MITNLLPLEAQRALSQQPFGGNVPILDVREEDRLDPRGPGVSGAPWKLGERSLLVPHCEDMRE